MLRSGEVDKSTVQSEEVWTGIPVYAQQSGPEWVDFTTTKAVL